MKHSAIYLILFSCLFFFSACCTFRNYAPFSEPAPALDSARELQMNCNIGLMRLEANVNGSPVNHLGLSISGGVRLPLSVRWSASALQFSAGYFDAHDNHGFEVFGGWGFQKFNLNDDTCNFQRGIGFLHGHDEYVISDTFFHYKYFALQPDVWWQTGAVKLIGAINFKLLSSSDYQFYLKKYSQYYEDSIENDVSISQYSGPLHLLMIEPSVQFHFGVHQVRFFAEGKYSVPVTANINVSKYFSPSTFLFTVGLLFVFPPHDPFAIFDLPHH